MQHPAFQSPLRLLVFTGSCLLVGLAVSVSQSGLLPVSPGILIIDGVLSGLLFGILSTLLWYVIHYAGLTGNETIQKVINYTALVVLLNLFWLGADYFLLYICISDEAFSALVNSLPLKTILGILIYTLIIRILINISPEEDISEEEPEGRKNPDFLKPGAEEVNGKSAPSARLPEKITVKVGQKIHVIAIPEIHFIQAEGDYVKIHTASSHFIKEQTMKYFEENLPSEKFVRIHRSIIVNTDVISRIELYEKQFYRITLQSGYQLKASASGYKLLKNTLQL